MFVCFPAQSHFNPVKRAQTKTRLKNILLYLLQTMHHIKHIRIKIFFSSQPFRTLCNISSVIAERLILKQGFFMHM